MSVIKFYIDAPTTEAFTFVYQWCLIYAKYSAKLIIMKIDRLLAIFIYLLNRDIVTARELARHFDVSIRTIQRDMDSLTFAGIPVVSIQGPQGGYGIMNTYKLDRQMVDSGDLFFILTALESIGSTFKNTKIQATFEKVKNLVGDYQSKEINRRKQHLYIDFSAFSLGKNTPELFSILDEAMVNQQVISFEYTDSNYKVSKRSIEPMTIVFKWYAWYLFGYCLSRNDYRLFRLSRMSAVNKTGKRFTRRNKRFEDIDKKGTVYTNPKVVHLKLKFDPAVKNQVEDYFRDCPMEAGEDGSLIVRVSFPENEWVYSMILAYGEKVEVIEPQHLRQIIKTRLESVLKKY